MKRSEEVTFASSGLNRAAHRRKDADWIKAALAEGAPVLPLWRGKPLMEGLETSDGPVRMAFRPMGHPVLAEAEEPPVFLGLSEDDTPLFALDVSAWVPDDVDEDQVGAFLDPTVQQHPSEDGPGTGFAEIRSHMIRFDARDAELAATARAILMWHATHPHCARCGAATVPAEAGWQRSCPACSAHHFPRTDPVVIMLITDGNRVLLGRSPQWPERMYSLLAGFVEPGETVEAAVRREVFEEAGVRVGRVDYLSSQPWPYPASLMIGCRGEALSREITIDPVEIEHARWVSRDEMVEVVAGRHPEIAPARRGAIAHFLIHAWLADELT